jgi:hypothetical protein
MRGLLLALLLQTAPGRETPLLEVDLRKGSKQSIDQAASKEEAELDAALGSAIGAGDRSFSTQVLDGVEQKLVAEEKRERPRATPGMIIFLYPGRVSAEKLKTLSEVFVDIELVIDPCERAVCREAMAKQIELVGRAVGRPQLATARYKLSWKTLIMHAATQYHDADVQEIRIPIPEAVAAAQKRGGGNAWLEARSRADTEYEPLVARAIAQAAQRRRVSLAGPPSVSRGGGEAAVTMRIHSDRNRVQQHVLDALAAAETALRGNPATPARQEIDVVADGTMPSPRRFRAQGSGVASWLDGSMSAQQLWATYVIEQKKEKGAQTLSFNDSEASGKSEAPVSDANDADAINALAANFAPLGACARAEAARNKHFAGVTLQLRWMPSGEALDAHPKESSLRGGELDRCLAQAVRSIRLPTYHGSPHTIDFPIRVKSR